MSQPWTLYLNHDAACLAHARLQCIHNDDKIRWTVSKEPRGAERPHLRVTLRTCQRYQTWAKVGHLSRLTGP